MPGTDRGAGGLITADMMALIGEPAWPEQTVEVHEADIRRYQEAVGDERLRRNQNGTLTAPPMFLPPFAVGGRIGRDGRRVRPGERRIKPAGLSRRLMGGCRVHFGEPICAGETITATTTFADFYEKPGRDGPMVFVVTDTRFENQEGAHKRTERWTIIHR